MNKCYNDGDFGKYFKENMDALGVPTPNSLFDTYSSAVANASLMSGAIYKLGARATVAELARATLFGEKLLLAGAFGAVIYTGVTVGSLAVASGRSLGCGTRISDMFTFIGSRNLQFPGWETFYHRYPQVIEADRPLRRNIGMMARMAA